MRRRPPTDITIRLLLCAMAVLAACGQGRTQTRFSIDRGGSGVYLPYRVDILHSTRTRDDQPRIVNPWKVFAPGILGSREGLYVSMYNPSKIQDRTSTIGLFSYPQIDNVNDSQVELTIRDWNDYPDSVQHKRMLIVSGFRHDSAFVYRFDPWTGARSAHFLIAGSDSTGKGGWEPQMDVLGVDDYDRDGRTEVLLYINTIKECDVNELFCLEMETLQTEWSLPVSPVILPNHIYMLTDSISPAIIFTSYNPKNGETDSVFSDFYAYLTKVDVQGRVVINRVLAEQHLDCYLDYDEESARLYLFHEFDLRASEAQRSSDPAGYFISAIDTNGDVIHTVSVSEKPRDLWLREDGPDHRPALHVGFLSGIHRLYDTALTVIAVSDSVGRFAYLGRCMLAGQDDPVILASDGIYSADYAKLAAFPEPVSYAEPLGYDLNGNVTTMILDGAGSWVINPQKRPVTELASVFYVRNQKYILAILSGLLVGLIVMNYYRHRLKGELQVIAAQRDELKQTHEALKSAQAQLVEQAKYRRALPGESRMKFAMRCFRLRPPLRV